MDVEKLQLLNVLDMLRRVIVRQDHIMVGKNMPPGFTPNQVNSCIKKDSPKVVDTIDMEDMGDKVRNV